MKRSEIKPGMWFVFSEVFNPKYFPTDADVHPIAYCPVCGGPQIGEEVKSGKPVFAHTDKCSTAPDTVDTRWDADCKRRAMGKLPPLQEKQVKQMLKKRDEAETRRWDAKRLDFMEKDKARISYHPDIYARLTCSKEQPRGANGRSQHEPN